MAEPPATGAIPLDALDLAVAALLVLVAGILSVLLKLRMGRQLAIASVRTVVQLLLVGYLLKFVFDVKNSLVVVLVLLAMVLAASHSAVQRPTRRIRGILGHAFVTLLLSGLLTTLTVTRVVIGVHPWYNPQYLVPLLGMALGNSLTGISLCLDYLLERLAERCHEVEMELAYGATAWEAAKEPIVEAVRRGMIPIINSMMVVGIVSLPGMMTGQILAGADPLQAVKYQIVIMAMIAAATSTGCILIAVLVFKSLFNDRHQLRSEKIVRK